MGWYMRDMDRRCAEAGRKAAADRIERLGISDAMWDRLQELPLARLTRERGDRASMSSPTLVALEKRGLATWTIIEGEQSHIVLWRCTDAGERMMRDGRP